MSLGGMARESVARMTSAGAKPAAGPSRGGDDFAKAREGLAHYVPTEVVAFFVTALGIANAARDGLSDEGYRALVAALVAAGAIFSFVGVVAIFRNALEPPPPWKRSPWRKAWVACLAFVLWALAMPGVLVAPWEQALAAIGALAVTLVFHWFDRWIETIPA